ncbi:MAG: phosphoglycerate dehydrogenase [Chloroflexi bacterium]|nr:phosphoglycerate dehydrogenase [Chloroflexota bacterium]
MKVLITDPIAADGVEMLKSKVAVDEKIGIKPAELISIIDQYDALVVRSETKVTAEVIDAGTNLKVIGRAGVGVDNIDVDAATRRGIAVVNAPTSNNIAAAEHTIALMLSLARHIPIAHGSLKAGQWQRSKFVGVEVRNKTLGVIGLGKVGTEVAKRAQGLEMKVIAFDPFVAPDRARKLGIEMLGLDELLQQSDFVTVHTPLTQGTRGLITERELALMKPSARIINCARGGIVNEEALFKTLEDGKLSGAAIDVFSVEPAVDNILLKSDKVVVTPHLGASTAEAQVGVALDVAEQIIAVLNGQSAKYAVNVPLIPPETLSVLTPYMRLAELLGGLGTQLAEGQLGNIGVMYNGDIANYDTGLLKAGLIKGLLEPVSEEVVNLVNANVIANSRGLHIIEQKGTTCENYTSLVTLKITTSSGVSTVAGTVMRGEPHIVQVDGYWLDVVPSEPYLLFSHHRDRPGIIGAVGTLLGRADINISFMQLGRMRSRGPALMVLGLDEEIPEEQRKGILAIPDITTAKVVKL